MADEATREKFQGVIAELTDDITIHDKRGLASLRFIDLERQRQARTLLQQYVTDLWETAKIRGVNPALLPEWQCIAAVRDLLTRLEANALEVRRD